MKNPVSDSIPKMLFIFPHPDDESFLVGGAIAKYAHSGKARVFLCTLTHGESSRNAAFHGISPTELASMRREEVKEASRILGIAKHYQGDFPDGGLRDLDPRMLEQYVEELIEEIQPEVIVTFDVQGGSVHPDHIVIHHIVKRVFVTMKEKSGSPRRLVFAGLPHDRIAHWPRKVFGFPRERIHAVIDVKEYAHIDREAVMAHASVRRDVEEHNYDGWMYWDEEYFSFFQESFDPPVDDLLYGITTG